MSRRPIAVGITIATLAMFAFRAIPVVAATSRSVTAGDIDIAANYMSTADVFPATSVLDDFARADGSPGSNWAAIDPLYPVPNIANGQLVATDNASGYWTSMPPVRPGSVPPPDGPAGSGRLRPHGSHRRRAPDSLRERVLRVLQPVAVDRHDQAVGRWRQDRHRWAIQRHPGPVDRLPSSGVDAHRIFVERRCRLERNRVGHRRDLHRRVHWVVRQRVRQRLAVRHRRLRWHAGHTAPAQHGSPDDQRDDAHGRHAHGIERLLGQLAHVVHLPMETQRVEYPGGHEAHICHQDHHQGTTLTVTVTATNANGSAAATSARKDISAAAPAYFKTCKAFNKRYPHGVGRLGAHDHTSGRPVTNFKRSNRIYGLVLKYHRGLDSDHDGVACERH